jgi:hypothetical protein
VRVEKRCGDGSASFFAPSLASHILYHPGQGMGQGTITLTGSIIVTKLSISHSAEEGDLLACRPSTS